MRIALALCSVLPLLPLPVANWAADADPWPNDFDKRIGNWKEFQPMPNAPTAWAGEHAPFWPSLCWRVHLDKGEVIATPISSRDRSVVERLLEEEHAGMPFKPRVNGRKWSTVQGGLRLPCRTGGLLLSISANGAAK